MLRTSDSVVEINKAMAEAQKEIGFALKDQNNPFFKSKYADLASVWRALAEPMGKNGLSVTQDPGVEVVNGQVFVTVTTRISHSSGQWMEGTCALPAPKPDAQAYGAAITYARRYSLSAMMGVIQEDDDGETAVGRGKSQAEPAPTPKAEEKPAPAKKQKATAAAKPGQNASPKSGEKAEPSRKDRVVAMAKWLQSLGAESADDCELILKHCVDGVTPNPTWVEVKEDESINPAEFGAVINKWLKINNVTEDQKSRVVATIKELETVPA